MNRYVLGLDIGGTNCVWGLVDKNGHVIFQSSERTAKFSTSRELALIIKEWLDQILSDENAVLIGIGVGAPNGNFRNGTIDFAPNLSWKGIVPIRQDFETVFKTPTFITNDANAAAMGEYLYGSARGLSNFIMITLGTGLGSGFYVGGSLMVGHTGMAGEMGHMIIEANGRPCGCGRNGCLETYVSATGIQKTTQLLLMENKRESTLRNIDQLSSKAIGQAANEGDKIALMAFDITAKMLGFAIANTITITSPSHVFLFGGLANAGHVLLEPTQKYMNQFLLQNFKDTVNIQLSSVHEKYAAILGASAIAWNSLN